MRSIKMIILSIILIAAAIAPTASADSGYYKILFNTIAPNDSLYVVSLDTRDNSYHINMGPNKYVAIVETAINAITVYDNQQASLIYIFRDMNDISVNMETNEKTPHIMTCLKGTPRYSIAKVIWLDYENKHPKHVFFESMNNKNENYSLYTRDGSDFFDFNGQVWEAVMQNKILTLKWGLLAEQTVKSITDEKATTIYQDLRNGQVTVKDFGTDNIFYEMLLIYYEHRASIHLNGSSQTECFDAYYKNDGTAGRVCYDDGIYYFTLLDKDYSAQVINKSQVEVYLNGIVSLLARDITPKNIDIDFMNSVSGSVEETRHWDNTTIGYDLFKAVLKHEKSLSSKR